MSGELKEEDIREKFIRGYMDALKELNAGLMRAEFRDREMKQAYNEALGSLMDYLQSGEGQSESLDEFNQVRKEAEGALRNAQEAFKQGEAQFIGSHPDFAPFHAEAKWELYKDAQGLAEVHQLTDFFACQRELEASKLELAEAVAAGGKAEQSNVGDCLEKIQKATDAYEKALDALDKVETPKAVFAYIRSQIAEEVLGLNKPKPTYKKHAGLKGQSSAFVIGLGVLASLASLAGWVVGGNNKLAAWGQSQRFAIGWKSKESFAHFLSDHSGACGAASQVMQGYVSKTSSLLGPSTPQTVREGAAPASGLTASGSTTSLPESPAPSSASASHGHETRPSP